MSDKQRLQVNNTNLSTVLSKIGELPIGGLYIGDNPLTIGTEGFTLPANTLIKEALQIINGVEPGVTGIDYGEVTISSNQTEISVNHSLGAIPTYGVLAPKTVTFKSYASVMITGGFNPGVDAVYGNNSGGLTSRLSTTASWSKDMNTMTFKANSTYNPFAVGTYIWIAIA